MNFGGLPHRLLSMTSRFQCTLRAALSMMVYAPSSDLGISSIPHSQKRALIPQSQWISAAWRPLGGMISPKNFQSPCCRLSDHDIFFSATHPRSQIFQIINPFKQCANRSLYHHSLIIKRHELSCRHLNATLPIDNVTVSSNSGACCVYSNSNAMSGTKSRSVRIAIVSKNVMEKLIILEFRLLVWS